MKKWVRADIALSTGVAVAAAVGTISAVLLSNVPLGALAGIVSGALVLLGMWPKLNKSNETGRWDWMSED